MTAESPAEFRPRFEAWAGRVRRRLLGRRVLAGATLGLLLGAAAAGALWWQRQGPLRPWAFALGGAGALVGLGVGLRRRWSDAEIALYLDARLDGDESVATALELSTGPTPPEGAGVTVLASASGVLAGGDPRRARPEVVSRWHALGAVGAAGIVAASLVALPPAPPAPPPAPGEELVKVDNLPGLDRIEALAQLPARDPGQAERLRAIAEEARKLREDLRQGLARRDAQDRIARLRDSVAAERLSLGDQKNRAGLEAALGELSASDATRRAARALGDGDLIHFDEEMKRLANQAEAASRDAAKEALKRAEEAARQKGADDVARELAAQREAFARREAEGQALRELAEALKQGPGLTEEQLEDLREFGQSGSPEAQRRLAEGLNDALGKLTAEERQRLAEALKKRLAEGQEQGQGGVAPLTREQLEDMARRLATPEGRAELEQQLRELAEEGSPGAEREQGLGEADRGGGEAQRELGVPLPTPGAPGGGQPGPGQPGPPGSGGPPGGQPGGAGSHRDTGTGDHRGESRRLEARELRSKADARMNPGAPMHGVTVGRAPGRAGETANQRGTGALGEARADELGAVEGSEVPDEYREQVGRYFQP